MSFNLGRVSAPAWRGGASGFVKKVKAAIVIDAAEYEDKVASGLGRKDLAKVYKITEGHLSRLINNRYSLYLAEKRGKDRLNGVR